MGDVHLITASAGTGKTTRLCRLLEEALLSGAARPEAVLATTFTTKAAAELEERVRTRLVEAGRTEEALRLGVARLGTVNSICARLVGEFALELGLSPDVRTLDERSAAREFRQALSQVVSLADELLLGELQERFHDFQPAFVVDEIVRLARTNGMGPGDLLQSAARSRVEVCDRPCEDGGPLETDLEEALQAFLDCGDLRDETQSTLQARDRAQEAMNWLRQGRTPPWPLWSALSRQACGVRSRQRLEPVRTVAARWARHPRFRGDLAEAIGLAFDLARRGMEAYAEGKRAAGVLDFTDQETLALELLRRPEVRSRLEPELDLVLIDEFQDTSPLQLALFLELASLARRSVWVGDPKQAIFGFRGTDPELMEAAQKALGTAWETLGRSYRSRPLLVSTTSRLFVEAFASWLPLERVALQAAVAEDVSSGPCFEFWRLDAPGGGGEPVHQRLASTLRSFLHDADVQVRDPSSGALRSPQPRDIAVLCMRNSACAAVARHLEALGLPVSLPRGGLLRTPEGLLVMAGLRLWADPGDLLARSELARFTTYADDADGWLERALVDPELPDVPVVQALLSHRRARLGAGPVTAMDEVLHALGARELCLAWGASEARLANLEALRALAVVYTQECELEGRGCTVAGLLAFLSEVRDRGEDAQGRPGAPEGISVTTWHAAKGLEWPVVILYDLDGRRGARAGGVSVVSDCAGFDVSSPLAGRWIRYWPQPLHPSQPAQFEDHPAVAAEDQRRRREDLRLLYVGWTRARDLLVLAGRSRVLHGEMLGLLRDASGKALLCLPQAGVARWAGQDVFVVLRGEEPAVPAPKEPVPGEAPVPAGPREHPPAHAHPSQSRLVGAVVSVQRLGDRLQLRGGPPVEALGNAIHAFLAADGPDLCDRPALARRCLGRWEVREALVPQDLVRASDAFRAWVERRWPRAVWHPEFPVSQVLETGTRVQGVADLVLETSHGLVVVDHKTFRGGASRARKAAAGHYGQLASYAAGLEAATGRRVLGTWVHLPVVGVVIEVRREVEFVDVRQVRCL